MEYLEQYLGVITFPIVVLWLLIITYGCYLIGEKVIKYFKK